MPPLVSENGLRYPFRWHHTLESQTGRICMDFKNYNIVDGFNIIAPAYDIANDAMTLGLHRLWRKRMIRQALRGLPKGSRLLDVATGTGDVLLQAEKIRPDLQLVGVDPSHRMLEIAKQKFIKTGGPAIQKCELINADARQLPFEANLFDVVTISWGIRNVKPYTQGLQEIKRVLKPGGRLVVLESGQPEFKVVREFYKVYSRVLPYIGQAFSKFRPAYQYYSHSVDKFPSGSTFVADMFELGFQNCKYRALAGGIVYIYEGQKSKES
jgi:demethylmenaquinone methyltransferase/2-methoxy-6-polyprenyl-1,4-benzoquinol methylase